jgi:hypothetical protein
LSYPVNGLSFIHDEANELSEKLAISPPSLVRGALVQQSYNFSSKLIINTFGHFLSSFKKTFEWRDTIKKTISRTKLEKIGFRLYKMRTAPNIGRPAQPDSASFFLNQN